VIQLGAWLVAASVTAGRWLDAPTPSLWGRLVLLAVVALALVPWLRDAWAGIVLAFERSLERGDLVDLEDGAARVEALGLRAVVLRRADGSREVFPYRRLMAQSLRVRDAQVRDAARELLLPVPSGVSPEAAVAAARVAAGLTPLGSPQRGPRVFLAPLGPGRRVGVKVVGYAVDPESVDAWVGDVLARYRAGLDALDQPEELDAVAEVFAEDAKSPAFTPRVLPPPLTRRRDDRPFSA
jgi:hypothetical protein